MLNRKISTAIATASILASVFAPAAFAEDVVVSGNGKGSDNLVVVADIDLTVVGQENETTANTLVLNVANTGDNSVNGNTGAGNSSVETGKVKSSTDVTVIGGDNSATLDDSCGCDPVETVKVSGNGKKSENTVVVVSGKLTLVGQSNSTSANTAVVNLSNTGGNKVKDNTGTGNKKVTTGKVSNKTNVKVKGGSNTVK